MRAKVSKYLKKLIASDNNAISKRVYKRAKKKWNNLTEDQKKKFIEEINSSNS